MTIIAKKVDLNPFLKPQQLKPFVLSFTNRYDDYLASKLSFQSAFFVKQHNWNDWNALSRGLLIRHLNNSNG